MTGVIEHSNVIGAFSLTLLAGAATGIGSAIAFFARRTNTAFLSVALGFSAGVMIYVSFTEILTNANQALLSGMSPKMAGLTVTLAFFGGMAVVALIDRLVPAAENPHEMHKVEEMTTLERKHHKLMRMGMMSALAIGIHNFPEGLATFVAAMKSPTLGLSIATAIAIHNIPEGIAVSVPIYYATGSRKKAFLYSFLSGMAEPVGALVGYFLLLQFLNDVTMGIVFASVAGIMVFISFDELLPAAEKYGEHHLTIYGLVAGMIIMAGSLLLLM